MYNCVIGRYHEIATKGNNRIMFERTLLDNIRHQLRNLEGVRAGRVRGRIWIDRADGNAFTDCERAAIADGLKRVCGLCSYSFCARIPAKLEDIEKGAVRLAKMLLDPEEDGVTFRIRARRSDKRFPLRSHDLEIDLVTKIAEEPDMRSFSIDLDNAKITLGVEIRDEFAVLYTDSVKCIGGLPTGSNPRVLSLLSGGIDSPVASFLMMKRGAPCDYVSFHSAPYTPPETTEKVRRIARHLNRFQMSGTLHLVNLAEFQKLVRDNCEERFRTILYRRAMMRISEIIARRTGCRALATGEALGQVASQTLINLDVINRSVDMLILRPIIGEDKLDTIATAEKIGTMELSAPQVPDSCTVFAPTSPATAAPLVQVERQESLIPGYSAVLEKIASEMESLPTDEI
ncbi:MAG: tRNA 4-thiouridine(8) synthase ThiI [Victivallaceae bacterium]|nr:tRNA 4-thiouridine(8) synthase ThiI [Victivallaceae bacterium]